MTDRVTVLGSSVEHLTSLVEGTAVLVPETPAFPSEWSIADTMSHIGSGAVIMKTNAENIVKGRPSVPDFNQTVWDSWNAKAPAQQVADGLVAVAALQECLEAITEDQRRDFHFEMGPFNLDFDGFVGLRLNEQALHTWDIEYVLDPAATLSEEVASVIIDDLGPFVRLAGKALGEVKDVTIRTTSPSRDLVLAFTGDAIELRGATPGDHVDIELPAETFVRLVYGRLVTATDTAGHDGASLEDLAKSFPGF
jgi:uncharacterized protein (TIGR03083 family)